MLPLLLMDSVRFNFGRDVKLGHKTQVEVDGEWFAIVGRPFYLVPPNPLGMPELSELFGQQYYEAIDIRHHFKAIATDAARAAKTTVAVTTRPATSNGRVAATDAPAVIGSASLSCAGAGFLGEQAAPQQASATTQPVSGASSAATLVSSGLAPPSPTISPPASPTSTLGIQPPAKLKSSKKTHAGGKAETTTNMAYCQLQNDDEYFVFAKAVTAVHMAPATAHSYTDEYTAIAAKYFEYFTASRLPQGTPLFPDRPISLSLRGVLPANPIKLRQCLPSTAHCFSLTGHCPFLGRTLPLRDRKLPIQPHAAFLCPQTALSVTLTALSVTLHCHFCDRALPFP